jgi:NADH-quinone oxidoreductase subunit G
MSDTSFNDSNVYLLLGINLKLESPILNVRIRSNVCGNAHDVKIGYIGTTIISTYPVLHLGLSSAAVLTLLYGKSSFCHHMLWNVDQLVCVTGAGSVAGCDRGAFTAAIRHLTTQMRFVSLYSTDITANDLGVVPTYEARTRYVRQPVCSFVYSVGCDSWTRRSIDTHITSFTVYQGHNIDTARVTYDVLLPCSAFTEQDGSYVNCFGMVQRTVQAQHALGMSERSELVTYSLLRYLAGRNVSFAEVDSLYTVYFPSNVNYINDLDVCSELVRIASCGAFITSAVYVSFVRDYFGTDVICRNASSDASSLI